ncbi:MAG: phosphodiester glycosidase family protein [Polyangiaceae bacterium]
MSAQLRSYLASRRRTVLWIAAAAAAAQVLGPSPPEPSTRGVAQILGASIGGQVDPTAFYWEPSGGTTSDLLFGRRVVFLGRRDGDTNRDVFRAAVRVSRNGRPLNVVATYNLTKTSASDEQQLVTGGNQIAFVSDHAGSVRGVSVLQLAEAPPKTSWMRGLGLRLRAWLDDGSPNPLRRRVVAFQHPPKQAAIELRPEGLAMALGTPSQAALWRLDTLTVTTEGPDKHGSQAFMVPIDTSWCHIAGRLCHALQPSRGTAPTLSLPLGTNDEPPPIRSRSVESAPELKLITIDTRRVGLGIAAGYSRPQAQTGPGGSGRLQPTPSRLLARFGGGPTWLDPTAGLVVDRRVLIPLERGRPSVALDEHANIFLGTWRGTQGDQALEKRWRTVFQGHETLVRDGQVVPSAAQDKPRTRVSLCRTKRDVLLYSRSPSMPARQLAELLVKADCAFAMTIDRGGPGGEFRALHDEEASPAPDADTTFFLYARSVKPVGTPGLKWTVDGGTQPQPSWLPAIFTATTERQGARIKLLAIKPGRLRWTLRAGTRETAARTVDNELSKEERDDASIALSLGVARRGPNRRGLVLDGVRSLPLRPDLGILLTLPVTGELAIGLSSTKLAPSDGASEVVLLSLGGKLRTEARQLGAVRQRSAICKRADALTLIAHGTHDSHEPLTHALIGAGCPLVVALDRGRQTDATIHRAGTTQEPRAQYEDTTLYGLAVAPRGAVRSLP